MKQIWLDAYEEVWNEMGENTTEEQIVALTEQRFKDKLGAMLEARLLHHGRLN